MRILVVGGYGLIGSAIVARLHAEDHDVVGAGRAIAAARRRAPAVRWIEADLGKATTEDWGRHLDGIEAVVNCAGALQDGGRDNLRAVHFDGVARLLKACEQRGVTRFVHISAAGLAPGRGAGFNDTKLMSEALIEASSLDWLILRPALVIGPVAYGGTALLRGLAAFPFVIPSVYPASLVQVVAIEDVAEAVRRSLGPEVPVRVRFDLAHREVHRLDHILKRLRSWLGLPEAPVLALPAWLGRITAATCDLLGLLGWRSPLRTTALEQLRQDVRGDPSAAETTLDLTFLSLDEILMRWPSGVQERWFGKSYFLKPLMVAILAVFWTLSGVIGLTAGAQQAASVLTAVHMQALSAQAFVALGSIIDIALGLAVCFRSTAARAMQGMMLVSAVYLVAGTALRPDLWADPLGPFVKTVPSAVLALAALALLDER